MGLGTAGGKTPEMQTYAFKVVVEPDDVGFFALCPALRKYGAVTQGKTEEEALRNIHEVVRMVVDELREDGIPLPGASADEVEVFDDVRVAVTI
jgi:predicted RNase H-like HicB family nuclease